MEEAKSITDKHSREPKKTIGHSYGTGPPRYMGMIELVSALLSFMEQRCNSHNVLCYRGCIIVSFFPLFHQRSPLLIKGSALAP